MSDNRNLLETWVDRFLQATELEKGQAKKTVVNYAHWLSRFVDFAEEKGVTRPQKIDLDLVQDFRLHLKRLDPPLAEATQNYHLIALRSFLKHLAKNDVKSLAPEKIELGKPPEREVSFLDGDEVRRLLQEAKVDDNVGLRNRAILEVLFSTGTRVSELVSLNRDDVNLERGEFSVLGKGGKRRVVFLSEEAKKWLKEYLKTRKDKDKAIFMLTPRQVERIVQKAAKKAGIVKKVTPHTLRHSYATDLIQGGADLRSVQALLGHASVTTTQIYTHVTNPQLREIHRKFHRRKQKEK